MMKKPFILVYTGPTGVGKTSLIDTVAESIPSEIINIDMGQFYAPLSIGTAKPDWKGAAIPHHLFDVITEPRDFTVAQYRERIIALIHDVWGRGKIPVLVGGSGFYVRSLFYPPIPSAEISDKYARISKEKLWDHLYEIDPDRADALEKQDIYRIERALDIWYSTGKMPSLFVPQFDPPCSFYLTCVTRERQELYQRIDERTIQMMDEGWLDEVAQLKGTEWEAFLMRKKLIGYADIFEYLENQTDKENLIATIAQKTRNYAKRQMTFWRSLKRHIDQALKNNQPAGPIASKTDEVNLTLTSLDVYIKRLLIELEPILKEL